MAKIRRYSGGNAKRGTRGTRGTPSLVVQLVNSYQGSLNRNLMTDLYLDNGDVIAPTIIFLMVGR
jgi:hypothetical protein